MFRAESLELLTRRRSRSPSREVNTDQEDNGNSRAIDPASDRHDTVPADDPDNVDDPDDCGPRLSVTLKDDAVGVVTNIRNGVPGHDRELPPPPVGVTAATAGAPAQPDLIDPVVLRTMPPQVAAFMLYEPRDPPPWREGAAGQRETREELEELGGWTGI